jgi:diacylglycerol kinase family enzyme
VVVANVGIMPGGFGLFPGARMDDGVLDIGVLFPKSVLGWALMARTVLAKGHFADRYFAHYRGQKVEVTAAEPLPRQLDGDVIAPGSSFTFNVAKQALRAKIPKAV